MAIAGGGSRACRRALTGLALVLAGGTGLGADGAASFETWLDELQAEARARDISPAALEALAGLRPNPRVVDLDRRQPEGTLSFAEYLARVVPDERVRRAREALDRHRVLLARLQGQYDVQPRFLVALWGVESDFGRQTGGFPVIEALATLAWDGRRGSFFRGELLDALRILDEGHVSAAAMLGSWAGAMGQPQFMPSTFRQYAVDYDGDDRRDIWGSTADALASTANFLARSGWRSDQTWGREVRLPAAFAPELVGREVVKSISAWQELGVRRPGGADLPRRDLDASLVRPGGPGGPTYLIYDNYRTLLRWNRSEYFATAVGLLSDSLR